MRLIEIKGKIWELTCLHDGKFAENKITSLEDANKFCIQGLSWDRGAVRVLTRGMVKSLATAVVETTVNRLPAQIEYEIYHCPKGFYIRVQNKRVFLVDLL